MFGTWICKNSPTLVFTIVGYFVNIDSSLISTRLLLVNCRIGVPDRVTSSVVCVIKDGGSVMRVVGVKSIVIRSEEFASNVKTEYNGFTNK